MIESIADLQALLLAGETDWKQYGEVNVSFHGDLILFNYSQMAQFQRRWNWFERNSRGLILNMKTGEVVARPFAKFFNYGEELPADENRIVSITEKMDGSLGILYREDGQFKIATRGSFVSDQAIWATAFLNTHHPDLKLGDELTLLFEIIYPENRIVVDYGIRMDLVLLAAVNRFSGDDVDNVALDEFAVVNGFTRAETYTFNTLEQIFEAAKALSANAEGWVLRYANGERYKVKGDAYKLAHKIMTGATFKRVLEAIETGQFDQMIEGVPDEFLAQVRAWRQEIMDTVFQIQQNCQTALAAAPAGTQKDFAVWVQANYSKDYQSYLFAVKAGKPLEPIIYKRAFENRQDANRTLVVDEG